MKIEEFRSILKSKKADFALFYSLDSSSYSPNLLYFTGYSGLGVLAIPPGKKPFLIAPAMEYEKAKSCFKNTFSSEKKRLFEVLRLKLKKNRIKAKKIALDKGFVTLNFNRILKKNLRNFKSADISAECLKLREIKTAVEIKNIKKACSIADNIFSDLVNDFKNFKTESEAAAFLEYESKKLGCDVSFPPIVASGSNSSMPHYGPKNIQFKKGFCVVDFGVRYKDYCSDMTRTLYIGKPNKKEKGLYNFLLNTQNKIIEDIKVNDKCGDIYNNCTKLLGRYEKYFTHGLGHGVGIEIHEMPNLTLNSKDKIQKNAVFTIEPGIYFQKKLGIRIEDTVLMNNNPIILTKAPKNFTVISRYRKIY